jgi:hypothetical protein
VQFVGGKMPDRGNPQSGETPLNRYRIRNVFTEMGGRTEVVYGHASTAQTCTAAGAPSYVTYTNTRECFPRIVRPSDPFPDVVRWYHKYVSPSSTSFERARGAGAQIVREPAQQPWGYSAAFADPDGHLWRVTPLAALPIFAS